MRPVAIVLVPLLFAGGCGPREPQVLVHELSGSIMGTTYSVKIPAPPDPIDLPDLDRQVSSLLASIDRRMSTYKADSELSQFNASDSVEWHGVSAELCRTVESALSVSRETNGAFDVTVGPAVNLWGFGPGEPRDEPPTEEQVAGALERIGYRQLNADCSLPALRKSRPDVYVDLSAIAKGHAVDSVAELLVSRGIANFLVEIGGELRAAGVNARNERWSIGIENPVPGEFGVQAGIHVADGAVATSGDYRNFFEYDGRRYSHTIDPRTARPVTHDGASVTVLDPSAERADALATALLVMGPEDGLAFADRHVIAAYFLVHDDDRIAVSASDSFEAVLQ